MGQPTPELYNASAPQSCCAPRARGLTSTPRVGRLQDGTSDHWRLDYSTRVNLHNSACLDTCTLLRKSTRLDDLTGMNRLRCLDSCSGLGDASRLDSTTNLNKQYYYHLDGRKGPSELSLQATVQLSKKLLDCSLTGQATYIVYTAILSKPASTSINDY